MLTLPPQSRSDFDDRRVLHMEGLVLADQFEDALLDFHCRNKEPETALLVDFSDSTYIDVAALTNFTAAFLASRSRSQTLYVAVPRDKRLRDFLRVWRFPEAFQETTKVPFSQILVIEDRQYLGEAQTTYRGLGTPIERLEYNRDWRDGHPGRRNFFEFVTYRVGESSEPGQIHPESIPRVEGRRWNNVLILQVLKTHLSTEDHSGNEISRVAVYESLSNAIRHPQATVVQAVSKFDPLEKRSAKSVKPMLPAKPAEPATNHPSPSLTSSVSNEPVPGTLRICVWDDGLSIIDTLKPLVAAGKTIRASTWPVYLHESIRFKSLRLNMAYFDSPGQVDKWNVVEDRIVSTSENPDKDADEALILLTSFFPGVSRTASESATSVEPFGESDSKSSLADSPGMGLFALLKTVIDTFKGVIFIRTGRHKFSIEFSKFRDHRTARYLCEIKEYPSELPEFKGNLLVLNIPVHRELPK